MDKDNSPIPRLSEFECLPEDTQKQIFDTIKSNNDISRRLLIEKVNAVAGDKIHQCGVHDHIEAIEGGILLRGFVSK